MNMALLKRRVVVPVKRAWRIDEWCDEMSLSRATVYRLMNSGELRNVRIGKARRILVSPTDFIASLRRNGTAG